MLPIFELLVLTAVVGAAIPIGGLLASYEHIHSNWLHSEFRHFVIAFGGGALFSAIALVLVPEVIALGATIATGGDFMTDDALVRVSISTDSTNADEIAGRGGSISATTLSWSSLQRMTLTRGRETRCLFCKVLTPTSRTWLRGFVNGSNCSEFHRTNAAMNSPITRTLALLFVD